MSGSNPIFVNDGDTLVLIAKTPICVSDPTDELPYVSKGFRVVADRFSHTLALVPLGETIRLSEIEVIKQKPRTDHFCRFAEVSSSGDYPHLEHSAELRSKA